MKRWWALALAAGAAACGGKSQQIAVAPKGASAEELDQLWNEALASFRRGKWKDAQKHLDSLRAVSPPGDPRMPQILFHLGEVNFARGENLEAVRWFRRVSDESPNDPLAAEALLRVGDAYADLWSRPELDPSYGQTALAAYQELSSRYPETPPAQRGQIRVRELEEKFAIKQYKAAMYYLRYKAFDSAALYLRQLVADYPRTSVAPGAVVKLIEIYRRLGYEEDVREFCGYLRRFHAGYAGADRACPAEAGTS
ncbi:MAG TPA: outer membrane protein assembly factor BamD [Gemmatimonadales bacterium]|jgi:outer membrane protein assembly factor BamD|nr:outer membrane protein assembly factor BamD [Gemmatimonadales bacterium]